MALGLIASKQSSPACHVCGDFEGLDDPEELAAMVDAMEEREQRLFDEFFGPPSPDSENGQQTGGERGALYPSGASEPGKDKSGYLGEIRSRRTDPRDSSF